jgi:hypothetical protein
MQNDQCKKVILTHVDQLLLQDEDVMGLDETLSTAPSPRWGWTNGTAYGTRRCLQKMDGKMQMFYSHSVPPQKSNSEGSSTRIAMVFWTENEVMFENNLGRAYLDF